MIAVIDISLINCHECLHHTGRCTCLKDNQEKSYILSQFYKSLTTNGVIQIINYCKNDYNENDSENCKNKKDSRDDNDNVTFNSMIDYNNDDYRITKKDDDNTRYDIINDSNRYILKQVKKVAYQFFNQSIEYKLSKCSKDKARRGYSSLYSENFSSLIGKYNRPNDSVEKYRIGPLISDMLDKKNIRRRKEERKGEEEEEEMIMMMNDVDNDNYDTVRNRSNDVKYYDQLKHSQRNKSHEINDEDYYHTKDGKIHFYENNMNIISDDFNYYLSKYYIQMDLLSRLIMKLISYCCHLLYYQNFDYLLNKATSILSLNYYPILNYTNNDEEKPALTSLSPELPSLSLSNHTHANVNNYDNHKLIRVSEHTDVSLFTIVYQSSQGLEIYDFDSHQYIPVNYIEDSMIVNIGDCLQYWSNGLFKSCKHRVVTLCNNNEEAVVVERSNNRNNYNNDENNFDDDEVHNDNDEADDNHKNDNTLNNTYPKSTDDNNDVDVVVDPDRLSFAFFFTPNYDISLEWPNTIDNDDDVDDCGDDADCGGDHDGGDHNTNIGCIADENSNKSDENKNNSKHHSEDDNHRNANQVEPKMTYSNWRKYHIKKAMQNLK